MKNSAPGFNELPAFIMKQCSKLYIKPLCHVLSLPIRQRVFPNELKLAKVLPIYKSDDFQKQFDLQDRNMGKTFKVIRTLLDKDARNNVSKSIDFVVNNTMTCDPKQISNSFNNYFISVGSTLASNIHSNVNPLLYVDSNVNSIIMPGVSEEGITSVILSINITQPQDMMICLPRL